MIPAAAAVASYGLTDNEPPFPGDPLSDDAFNSVLHVCEHHRLVGLLGAAVRDGALPVTDDQWQSASGLLDHWLAHALRVERLLLKAHECLRSVGIDHRVLKGVALAHLAYPDPAHRLFADADVLLPPGAFTASATLLTERLHVWRAAPELRPGFDDRFGREILLRAPGEPNPLELDLHRTFVDGPYGALLDPAELFARSTHFAIGGVTLETLDAEDQFLHACYSAVLADEPPRLMTLRDVAQVWACRRPDATEVLARARRRRAETLVARALRLTRDALGFDTAPELARWAEAHRPPARDRLFLAAYAGRAPAVTEKLAMAAVIPGVGARFAYLRAVAFPQRSYLEARGVDRAGLAARALRVGVRRPRATLRHQNGP